MVSVTEKEILLAKIVSILSEFNINYFKKEDVNFIYCELYDDMKAFLLKDPSAKSDAIYFLLSFSSFDSVIAYRIANYLLIHYDNLIDAKKISEASKVKTGIEIHPAAKIGKRFVIDHGIGTVIGETCTIGNDCYLLQKVILGSTRIALNKQGQRHPNIGDNVEIGGFVRVFGNVTIGNNVKISPYAIIRKNIPENSLVIVKNNKQEVVNK